MLSNSTALIVLRPLHYRQILPFSGLKPYRQCLPSSKANDPFNPLNISTCFLLSSPLTPVHRTARPKEPPSRHSSCTCGSSLQFLTNTSPNPLQHPQTNQWPRNTKVSRPSKGNSSPSTALALQKSPYPILRHACIRCLQHRLLVPRRHRRQAIPALAPPPPPPPPQTPLTNNHQRRHEQRPA